MREPLRWGYALNQWNTRLDDFVRHDEQLRALRTISALGFDGVELTAGSGRWENLGRPEIIELNHGGIEGFQRFIARSSLSGVSSMFWDPAMPAEEEGRVRRNMLDPADHDGIVRAAEVFVRFLAAVGGEQLVVRPAPSAWRSGLLDDGAIGTLASLWNRVGALASQHGPGLSLHVDCLSGLHTRDQLEALLAQTDPAHVGLALDTAEFTIAGIDPVAFYREHADRVTHVHLKDTRYADTGEEFLQVNAETAMLHGGAGRHIERWFFELGTEGGLVDVKALVAELVAHSFAGWVVVESDSGDDPAELAMLNSWFVQRELGFAKR